MCVCVYVCVIIIIIDGERGKTGGVAMQGCGGQVHTANIHIYIHLTIIYKYIHKYTYHTYTYTHTHLYNSKYFFFSMNIFFKSCHGREVYITPVPDSPSTELQESVFFHVFYSSCKHTYIQHTCIYTFSTHTYMLPAHIHPAHRHTYTQCIYILFYLFSLIQ